MKKIFFLLLIVFLLNHKTIFSQSILGVWQEATSNVSDSYLNTYEFKQDGTFEFCVNGYIGLLKVVALGGRYNLIKDSIKLKVEYIFETEGGEIELSEIGGTATGSWVLENSKQIKRKLQKKVTASLSLKFPPQNTSDKKNDRFVYLNKIKFFKVEK